MNRKTFNYIFYVFATLLISCTPTVFEPNFGIILSGDIVQNDFKIKKIQLIDSRDSIFYDYNFNINDTSFGSGLVLRKLPYLTKMRTLILDSRDSILIKSDIFTFNEEKENTIYVSLDSISTDAYFVKGSKIGYFKGEEKRIYIMHNISSLSTH